MHTETNNVKVGYGKAIILSTQMRSEGMKKEYAVRKELLFTLLRKIRPPAARLGPWKKLAAVKIAYNIERHGYWNHLKIRSAQPGARLTSYITEE